MRRLVPLALPVCTLAALVAGCGSDSPSTKAPAGGTPTAANYPAQGVSFKPPAGWSLGAGKGALVATVQAGEATVAVWRYPRSQALPESDAELRAARDALLDVAAKRDKTFTVIKTAPTTIAGEPAVQIRAKEMIAGQPRTVRSTHIYAHGAEYVIDAYADYDHFRRIDKQVFRPLLRTLQVSKPQGAA
jgi:hypothetical protein